MYRSGVSQVVLPLWIDLYNFAALAETLGVGIWGCKATSPSWTSECLASAFLQAVSAEDEANVRREKAKEIGAKVKARPQGRDIAARDIAKLACVGCDNVWVEDESCRRITQTKAL